MVSRLFQNIDFVSWWGPFYVLFAFEEPHVTGDIAFMVSQCWQTHPVATVLLLGYLALHILAMPYAAMTGKEILPFSSFHMFSDPKNLWDPTSSKSWWITTKEHTTGGIKHYAFPFCRKQHVMEEEMTLLPFKYLYICTLNACLKIWPSQCLAHVVEQK